MLRIAPEVIFSGTPELRTFAAFIEIVPDPLIITPPVAANVAGHSVETVLAEAPALYCNVAEGP